MKINSSMEISSVKRRWSLVAILLGTVAILTVYFASIMYMKDANSLCSIDSELCMWLSMGQEILQNLPHPGLIRLNYSRGVIELLFNAIVAGIVGVSVWKAMAVFALFNALTIVGMASLLSIAKDRDGMVIFSPLPFVALVVFQTAFYFINVGHEVSYVLVVAGLFVIQWNFSCKWTRHILLAVIASLGVINDDMFLLCFVAPVVLLNVLRFLIDKWYDKAVFSTVAGVIVGGLILKVLVACDIVWYLTSPFKIVRAQDLGAWFNDMFMSYLFMFKVMPVMGRELKSLDFVKFAAVASTMLLCLLSFVAATYKAIAGKFSKDEERSAYMVITILCITLSYLLLDMPTKQLGRIVARYVYFAVMAFLYLLVDIGFSKKMPTRCKVVLGAVCLLAVSFEFSDDYIRNTSHTDSRENLNALVEELKSQGIDHAYSDYWTSWSLVAASKGTISSVGLGYHKKIDSMGWHTIGFADASYDRECHAYVMPKRKRHNGSFDPEENRRVAIKTFGEPYRTAQIGEDYEVMYFENNIARGRPRLPNKKR